MGKQLEYALGIVFRPLLFALYFLSGWMPRNRRMWVFGSWDGQRFADNSAALFRHCAGLAGEPIEAIWISRRNEIVRDLRQRGYQAYHAWSPSGLWTCLRAGVFAFDGYTKDINHWVSLGAFRVHLRHGIATKKAERMIDTPGHRLYRLFHGHLGQRLFWRFMVPWHTVRLDLVVSTSPEDARCVAKTYGIPVDSLPITGFARIDMLLDEREPELQDADLEDWLNRARRAGRKVFLYMPTFRDDGQTYFPGSLQDFDRQLEKLGACVVWHQHFAERSGGAAPCTAPLKNIRLLDKIPDAQPLLRHADCLVTDYSSIYHDFLVLRRPVIFFVPDLDAYQRTCRSLWHEFDEVHPGPKVQTVAQLLGAVRDVAQGGGLSDVGKYEHVVDRFHSFQDAGACRRIYAAISARLTDRRQCELPLLENQYETMSGRLSTS